MMRANRAITPLSLTTTDKKTASKTFLYSLLPMAKQMIV
jgi:hypothetical protein